MEQLGLESLVSRGAAVFRENPMQNSKLPVRAERTEPNKMASLAISCKDKSTKESSVINKDMVKPMPAKLETAKVDFQWACLGNSDSFSLLLP